jgi:hypothetical protein
MKNTMHLRKFYINDIVIIAPLKSATRWLNDRSQKSEFIHIDDLKEEIKESYYFLYREGRSHLESALHTDYIINEFDLDKTISELLSHKSPHWRGDLYEHIHRAWCYNKFQMVEYTNVSELISDWDVNMDLYDFSMETNPITKRNVLDMVDTKTLSILYDMADNNNYWLEQILNGNDMALSKNIVDYEENRKDVLQSKIGLQLQHKLNELTTTNGILKHRMEYAEAMLKELGKKVIKLI